VDIVYIIMTDAQDNTIKYYCKVCNFSTNKPSNWKRHHKTKKHLQNTLIEDKYSDNETEEEVLAPKINCKSCSFETLDHSALIRHMKEHILYNHPVKKKIDEPKNYTCACGKEYKHRSGLSRHKKQCQVTEEDRILNDFLQTSDDLTVENEGAIKELIKMVMDERDMMMKMMSDTLEKVSDQNEKLVEIAQQPKTVINQQNNSFHIDTFLNVHCKDAMNMNDFIDGLRITYDDLAFIGSNGFVKGIKHTMGKELALLHHTKRPIHCTDMKRKTIYIKQEDKWQKDETLEKTEKAIKHLSYKLDKTMGSEFNKKPQHYFNSEYNENTRSQIIQAVFGYDRFTRDDYNKKIIRDIAQICKIDKNKLK